VSGKGIPVAETSVNDATNYALSVQNLDATNSRALNVLKSDGTLLIRADVNGVSLGTPLNPTAGSIQGTALANGTVANVNLGPDVARANMLVNPGFEWWQRGNGPFISAFSSDRWNVVPSGTDTFSVSKDTTNKDTGSTACAAVTFTLGTGAGASQVLQSLPAVDSTQVAGRTLSVSVRVRTSTANAVRVALNNYYAATSHQTYSSYHSGGGTYETLSVTASMDPTLQIAQVEIHLAASCTAYLDNACLVVGSQPANYVPLHPADDLARCLRYYEPIGADQNGAFTFSGIATAGSQTVYSPLTYRAFKAVTPTVTKTGTWTASNSGQPVFGAPAKDACQVALSSLAAGVFFSNNAAGCQVNIEANP
jgi:hypothetical protein